MVRDYGTMERETRIELATNSLEGCDSTIELLPLASPLRQDQTLLFILLYATEPFLFMDGASH